MTDTVTTYTFQTYAATGIREDLIDIITNISPAESWFLNSIARGRANAAVNHSWQTDTLAAAAANAHVEGSDADDAAVAEPSLAVNHCQILRKTWKISDSSAAVTFAGRSDPMTYHKMKRSREIAKDLEYALIINASAVSGGATTARQLKGVLGWIATNVTTATATSQAIDETLFNDNLGLIWEQGGTPRVTLVGKYNKRAISGFTSNVKNVNADQRKLIAAVDIYESEYGVIMVRLHHVVNTTAPGTVINLGDLSLWKTAWLRPVVPTPLAKVGSAERMMIEAEITLEALQEAGSGKMTGYKYA
jgi:hypothetical protein